MLELSRQPRGWIALVASLVLMLQAFTSVWAAGAMASSPQLDMFGNPLCITSTDHGDTVPAGDHSKLSSCCTFGCGTASIVLAAPAGNGVVLLRPLLLADVLGRIQAGVRVEALDHNPGSPRAPPLMS